MNQVVIPIKTDDHLIMVKIDDIILAEIDKNQLTIYTTDKTFIVRDTFDKFFNIGLIVVIFYRYPPRGDEYRPFGIAIG